MLTARCARAAPTTFRAVLGWKTRPCSTAWPTRLKARPGDPRPPPRDVEHPFGTIKQWMNQGAFLMRGLENVRAEFSLTALAYNLRRALNIVGSWR